MTTQKPTTRNCMKSLQKYKLYNWLENNQDLARAKTADSLAVLAAEKLGFVVTSANVDNARRALGIRFRIASCRPFESKSHDRTREVAKCVKHLYTELNIPIPEGLQRLISGKSTERLD